MLKNAVFSSVTTLFSANHTNASWSDKIFLKNLFSSFCCCHSLPFVCFASLTVAYFYQVLIGRAVVMKHSTPHNVLNACRSATATLTLAQADWLHFHVIFTHSSGNSDSCLWLCFHSLSAGVLRQSTCQLFPLPCQQIVKGSELSCTTYQQSKKTPQNPTMSSLYCTLQSLHWLPVRAQIQYKISTIWFNVIMHTKPL